LVAALVWIAFEDLSGDLRSEASRATAIAYGSVLQDASGSHFVIEEIWKNASNGYGLAIGTSIPLKTGGDSSAVIPDKAVVFFTHPVFSRNDRIQIGSVAFVHKGRVGSSAISVSELKGICGAAPMP
jgi:hypothetical protein